MTTGFSEVEVTVTLTEQLQGNGMGKSHRDWGRFKRDQESWNWTPRNRQVF